jgi:hypothetical protein
MDINSFSPGWLAEPEVFRAYAVVVIIVINSSSLRGGAADEAIHVYHHLKVFWIASCCVPRSRNDDLSCAFCDENHPSA